MKRIKNASTAGAPGRENHPPSIRLGTRRWALRACLVLLCSLTCVRGVRAQAEDNVRFTQGDVNESAILSLGVPIGRYKGRGLDLPISLTYSSAAWRIEHVGKVHVAGRVASVTQAVYAEHSAAGWKSTLDLPIVEFPKQTDAYSYKAEPYPMGTWNGCFGYRIARLYIHMPDGSTHEFRKSDQPYYSNTIDTVGVFYAVDNSRMRYDSSGPDTGTLYLPDGTRYVLGHPFSYVIDRNGNTQTYNEGTREWTDTQGRVILDPLPNGTPAQPQTYTVNLPGLNGATLPYTFTWRHLSEALTPDEFQNVPALRYVAGHYLPNPTATPSDNANYPVAQSAAHESLFQTSVTEDADANPVTTFVVGKGAQFGTGGQLFNPVVLAQIDLPDGTSYKFSYNVHGELDKVVYPSTAYELYAYAPSRTALDAEGQPYIQAERRVTSRRLSVNGQGDDILEWQYREGYANSAHLMSPTDLSRYRVVYIIAPDKTRTEVYSLSPAALRPPPFDFTDSRMGMVFQRKRYSTSPNGLGGTLLRRDIIQYEQKSYSYQFAVTCGQTPFNKSITVHRNARPTKEVNITFEGDGPALAQTKTYGYDTSGDLSVGVEQTSATLSHYAVVDNATAKTGSIIEIPAGAPAKSSETTHLDTPGQPNSTVYRNKNILGLATVFKVKDAAGVVVSQKETRYDESGYSPAAGRALPTSARLWDSTKGPATDPGAYLMTRAKFDSYGNRTEATDALGYTTTTEYDGAHHTYPVKTTTAVPDLGPAQNPDGQWHGSQTAFEVTYGYDFGAGLMTSKTDVNGQLTQIKYEDPFLRETQIIPPSGAGQTVTEYGLGTTDANRFVKVKKQVNDLNWEETTTFYDGFQKAVKTRVKDDAGDVFTETKYDNMGRVREVSNPYRAGETKVWSTTTYDDLGRITIISAADGSRLQTSYGLSTVGAVGLTKTNTDQAGRQRTGVTDAPGRMFRVVEDPAGQSLLTEYVFDALDNLRETIQGEQHRYFFYDSVGRVRYSKQPEQEANASFDATDPVTGNEQWSLKFNYDDNGNLVSTTDARGVGMSGTYDRLNRLVYRDYTDATPDVGFFYDGAGLAQAPDYANGRTTKVGSSVSKTRYTSFDRVGRVKSSEQETGGVTYAFPDYSYNLAGDLVSQTYPSGRVVKTTFDADGDLTKVEGKRDAAAALAPYVDQLKYTAAGSIKESRLGNGLWETTDYNDRMLVKQIGLGASAADRSLLNIEYGYGAAGLNNGSLREQKISNAGLAQPFVQTYTYDGLNRLQFASETFGGGTQSWKQTFSYDRYGNRRFDAAETNTIGGGTQAVVNPLINTSDNRFADGQGYVYDPAGNVTRDAENQRFAYDAEGRQKQFFGPANGSTTPDANYHYNGEGKRVTTVVGQVETVFVYDAGGQLAAEYSNQLPANRGVSYLTADHLGSPRVVTNRDGHVVSRHDYTAFGEEVQTGWAARSSTPGYGAGDGVRKGYTGYETDVESGLDYAQARYYNPRHGRFTSVDPLTASAAIRNPQTFNRYSYVINSPYKFVDPLGLMVMNPYIGWDFFTNTGDVFYAQTSTAPQAPPKPAPKTKAPDKPFDPAKDKPVDIEPGTATPVNTAPVGTDAAGNPIYDEKNKDAYNCHSYAWEDGKGDPSDPKNEGVVRIGATKWDQDPTNNMKGHKQLDANAPNQEGDKVVYYVDKNSNGKFDKNKDKVIHSAVVVKTDAEGNPELVRAKMGQDGLSTNHPRAPGYYDKDAETGTATSRAYFRKEEKKKKE